MTSFISLLRARLEEIPDISVIELREDAGEVHVKWLYKLNHYSIIYTLPKIPSTWDFRIKELVGQMQDLHPADESMCRVV